MDIAEKKDSGLVGFAKDEFKILGWDKSEDEMQKEVCKNIIELLSVLSKQGHSGFSIGYVLNLFNKLANYIPISPLTGEDSEWNDVGTYHDKSGNEIKIFQNKRCPSVFKDSKDSRAYDMNTSDDSDKKYISFPYTPSY